MASFWSVLRNALVGPVTTVTVTRRDESYLLKWTDRSTGKEHVYHSPSEVPADIRDQIAAALAKGEGVPGSVFVYQGADGRRHTLHSLGELPPEVRQAFESAVAGRTCRQDGEEVRTVDSGGRISATHSGGRLTVSYRGREWLTGILLAAGGLLLVGQGVRWFFQPSVGHWLGGMCVLFSLVGAYYGLQLLFNRTVIVISPSRFKVRNGPLPGWGVRRLSVPAHAVRRVEFRQFTVRYSHYSLWAHLTEGRAIKIVPEIASLEDGPVLKEMIERQLRANAKRGR